MRFPFPRPLTAFSSRFLLWLFIGTALLALVNTPALENPFQASYALAYYSLQFLAFFFLLIGRRFNELPFPVSSLRGQLPFLAAALVLFSVRFFLPLFPGRFLVSLAGLAALFAGLFGLDFIEKTAARFRRELLAAGLFFGFANLLWTAFETHWLFLAATTLSLDAFLLRLFFRDVYTGWADNGYPIVGAGDYLAVIYPECSGIQSLLLFSVFFLAGIALDYSRVSRKKAVTLFLAGFAGMYFVTVARIFLIVFVGAALGADLASRIVHNTLSLLLFVAYFFLYWGWASPRMRN